MDNHSRPGLLAVLCLAFALMAVAHAQESEAPPPEQQVEPDQPPPENADVAADTDADEGQETDDAEEAEDASATGDPWLDERLVDIGRYAARHRAAFIDELVRYLGAARGPATALTGTPGWEAGDVYFACALARVTGRSCRLVVDLREQRPEASWNALAASLGAGPGTEAFARLKRGVVHSYQRWGRPLALDEELSRSLAEGKDS
ncbi:MAG TPA: hypothetical protein H9827_04930 [Candidatus Luteimonas excrementigallinarum]|nr:hypothetical protein [Candidatus Luteimonas excrementigallinarum]